jgi:TRAP transporter TAXI family solute receptor
MEGRTRYIVVAIVWIATLSAVFAWFLSAREERLAMAAGPRNSESFQLALAIAEVFNESQAGISIDVFETSGSAENVTLLESGRIDFATVQADTQLGERVNAVASLYFDAFQLIVKASSNVNGFEDLAGKRVAIAPTGSGQNSSFWFVAGHYGLTPDRLTALPMSEDAANFAMIMGQVDAVFRVRAPGNPSIRELVSDHPMRLVPIRQSEALSLKQAAIAPGTIPLGSYIGSPPLPVRDLPTAVLERILVARADLSADLVYAMTRMLFERHSELIARNNLAGFIGALDGGSSRISTPVHAGAQRYYDREKPGFWQQNTRLLASLLYVIAILSTAGVALRSRLLRRHKVRIGEYTAQLMEIAEQARRAESAQVYYDLKDRLVRMLEQVVQDLDNDRFTQDEFEHFSFTWRAVDTLVRDRLTLARQSPALRASRPSDGDVING